MTQFSLSLVIYVLFGGAIGSVCRYLTMIVISDWLGKDFPYGTLIVNILGSFLLGLLIGVLSTYMPRGRELHALLAVGVLGGFTTFSTFSLDLYMLVEKGLWVDAAAYTIGSVVISVVALFLGMYIFRYATT